jgi:hypothetical protein
LLTNIKFTSKEKLKSLNKAFTGKKRGAFIICKNGEKQRKEFNFEVINGEVQTFEFTKPVGEMIKSDETQEYFLKEVYLEIELGKELEPLVYAPLYDEIVDINFPETFKAIWMQEGKVVFLKHIEGQEVQFGTRDATEGDTASLYTYSAGFEYTEDMIVYNQTFNLALLNKAMGEAYNALLNHIHLYPIISYSYTGNNAISASGEYDSPSFPDWNDYTRKVMNTRQTLIDAVKQSRDKTIFNPRILATKLLIASTNEQLIKDALGNLQPQNGGFPTSVQGIDEVISYDGTSITVGAKTYTYTGVANTKAYLIQPRKYLKSLVKHGLIVDAGNEDLSRLIEQQIVGRARLGAYAGVVKSVLEITLPT